MKISLFNIAIICMMAMLISCTAGNGDTDISTETLVTVARPKVQGKNNPAPVSRFNYNIYIENSGSMDGYVTGGVTEFQQNIYNLISDIKISKNTGHINLYYINSDTINILRDAALLQLQNFIQKLDVVSFKAHGGNRTETQLYDVIKKAIHNVDSNQVALVVSDFIFSPEKGVSADEYLVNQQIGFKNLFFGKIDSQKVSTLMLKFHSKFTGTYYDKDNKAIPFHTSPIQRPFYVMAVGADEAIRDVITLIDTGTQGGYEELCYLGKTPIAARKIVQNKKRGEFEIESPPTSMRITGAELEEDDKNKFFQFAIAADFSKLVCSRDYLLNTANYEVSPSNYSVKPELTTSMGGASLKGYTHLLVVSTSQLKNSRDSISITLKNTLPYWIEQSSSDNDNNILTDIEQQQKTFGLKYLMAGIKNAYDKTDSNRYLFCESISVSKATSGGPNVVLWFLFILLIIFFGYLILKKTKSP